MLEERLTNKARISSILALFSCFFTELVVEVVSCTFLREAQVSGEVVDVVAQCLLFLMQSSLCTEEVVLGDVGVRVLVLLNEELVGRSSWHIHHVK